MSEELWGKVDAYFAEKAGCNDAAFQAILDASDVAGLPAIAVSPNQGKLLNLWIKSIGARRVLEIGTLGGYSTAWMAKGLPPGGKVVTVEYEPHHAQVAWKNLDKAGFGDMVEIRQGSGSEVLPILHQEMTEPFDFVFIDADKKSTPIYFDWAMKMTRPGSLIVVDNVVRNGAVVDLGTENADVKGIQAFFDNLPKYPNFQATALQTVGSKGYDGFCYGIVERPL